MYKIKTIIAGISLFGLVACEEQAGQQPVGPLDSSPIAGFARQLAASINEGPVISNAQGARVRNATAAGSRLTLEMSLPVGASERSFVRFDTRIEEWQRRDLCRADVFAQFIDQGGEIEVDLQSRNGSTLHRVVVRDCD